MKIKLSGSIAILLLIGTIGCSRKYSKKDSHYSEEEISSYKSSDYNNAHESDEVSLEEQYLKKDVAKTDSSGPAQETRKKVLIFSSKGGGGHESARQALTSYLQDTYDISAAYIFEDVLISLDLINKISFGYTSGERIYNYFLTRKWFGTINVFQQLGEWYFKKRYTKIEHLISRYLSKQKPDLVISVIPMVNNAILAAAKKLSVPFLLIPTDLDITSTLHKVEDTTGYPHFRLALPFDEKFMTEKAFSAHIPREQIAFTGFPLRSDFFKEKNTETIKEKFSIPPNKPIVLILMGAAGSKSSYYFAKQLRKVTFPLHVISVLGRNEEIRQKVESIKFPKNISTTTFGFTSHIADLMAIADLCITKSGPNSICEAIYSNVPVLVDATSSSTLWWERMNYDFVEKRGFGASIPKYQQTASLVAELLTNEEKLRKIRITMSKFDKKEFGEEIKPIVASFFSHEKREEKRNNEKHKNSTNSQTISHENVLTAA